MSRGGGSREGKDHRDEEKAGEEKIGGSVAFRTQEPLEVTHIQM